MICFLRHEQKESFDLHGTAHLQQALQNLVAQRGQVFHDGECFLEPLGGGYMIQHFQYGKLSFGYVEFEFFVVALCHIPGQVIAEQCDGFERYCLLPRVLPEPGRQSFPAPAVEEHALRPSANKVRRSQYQRNGTANHFLFTDPLGSWRRVRVRETKTRKDWAQEMKQLLDEDYPLAQKVVLVCDNLNTHTPGAFYETFEPREARRLVERLEIHYTPKHGSWLNIAETELSVLTRQCLNRRIDDVKMLRREVSAWATLRNGDQSGVDWQFKTPDARVKLKRLYPQIKMK